MVNPVWRISWMPGPMFPSPSSVTRFRSRSQTTSTRLARQPAANVDVGVTQPSINGVSDGGGVYWPARPSSASLCQWPGSSSWRKKAVIVNGFGNGSGDATPGTSSTGRSVFPMVHFWIAASAALTAIS